MQIIHRKQKPFSCYILTMWCTTNTVTIPRRLVFRCYYELHQCYTLSSFHLFPFSSQIMAMLLRKKRPLLTTRILDSILSLTLSLDSWIDTTYSLEVSDTLNTRSGTAFWFLNFILSSAIKKLHIPPVVQLLLVINFISGPLARPVM